VLHQPFFVNRLGYRFIKTMQRRFALFLTSPYTLTDRTVLRLPPGYVLREGPPDSTRQEGPYGRYRMDVTRAGDGAVVLDRSLYLPVQRVEAGDDYLRFMAFCHGQDTFEKQPWIVGPATVSAEAGEAAPSLENGGR